MFYENKEQEKGDYHSRVPQFEFSQNLKDQKQELENNPLLKRFKKSRKNFEDDPYRPHYHFVSPESTMNDPNGLCYWQGRWHLFYQGYPPEDPRQHWGHAVSEDLIHWQDLPYAIYPHPEECCFSGATYVEEDRVIAMYHGTKAGNMIAVSDDPLLLNWKKLEENPVIPFPEKEVPYNVFDPCIWKKNGSYYSLSAGTLPHPNSGERTRADFLFRSSDLKKWEYLHPFVEGDRFTLNGDDGACPYFLPLGDRFILLFFSHMSGGQALLGDYDKKRDKFEAVKHFDFNFGAVEPGGVHAPSGFPDGKGGINVIFNMNPAYSTFGWDQIMTLPRNIQLTNHNELKITPGGDYQSLRRNHQQLSRLQLPANEAVELEKIKGKSIEIKAEIECSQAPLLEMKVLQSPNSEEFTKISFYRERGLRNWDKTNLKERKGIEHGLNSVVTLDNGHASLDPEVKSRPPEIIPVFLEVEENLNLHIFIDRSVVEVFINEKRVGALRVYPRRKDSRRVSLLSRGNNSLIKKLDCWQLQNIYK